MSYICPKCDKNFTRKSSLTNHKKTCDIFIQQQITSKPSEISKEQEIKQTKKLLGQFYTTNYDYILQDMKIPDNIKNIIEPFAGDGDLLNFIVDKSIYEIECYDISPKKDFIVEQDTIDNPPDYKNKFVITNPPFLARNKSKNKYIFDKYDVNDLYKCFIKELSNNICLSGIIITPLNFWSSIRTNDVKLRKDFLNVYKVSQINIFEEQVFKDTTYTICSFQFEQSSKVKSDEIKANNTINNITIPMTIYPSKIKINVELDDINYLMGGSIYHLKSSKYKIGRLTKKNINDTNHTNILVKCIDDSKNNKIGMTFVSDDKIYVDKTPNQSARTYATLFIDPPISKEIQKQLVQKFNDFLEEHRKKYYSLFLTNYRESKDIARKRISFDLVYGISGWLLDTL
jgi:hypothetical protein